MKTWNRFSRFFSEHLQHTLSNEVGLWDPVNWDLPRLPMLTLGDAKLEDETRTHRGEYNGQARRWE